MTDKQIFFVRRYFIFIYISYPVYPFPSFSSQITINMTHPLVSRFWKQVSIGSASCGAKQFLSKIPEVAKSLEESFKYPHYFQNQ